MGLVLFLLVFQVPLLDDENIQGILIGNGGDIPSAVLRIKESGITPYDYGIRLLRIGKGDEAEQWFQSLTETFDDVNFVYGRAWIRWKTGNLEAALKDAIYLTDQELTPILTARTYYLLGNLGLNSDRLDLARENLNAGLKVYKSLGKNGGQYLCYSLLAAVEIAEKNYDKVEPLLEMALKANQRAAEAGYKPYDMGQYHDLMGEMYFGKREYNKALSSYRNAYAGYQEGNSEYYADGVQVKIGILYYILGKPRRAYKIGKDINERYLRTNETRLYAFNNILLAMLAKCGQEEANYQARVNSAKDWAGQKPGRTDLMEVLQMLDKLPCPKL